MKGEISFRDKKLHFSNWGGLTIRVDGKSWFLFGSVDEEVLRFIRAPIGTRNSEAELGQELRWWRKKWKVTQEEAGVELEISQAMIAKIEKGGRKLTAEIYRRIRYDRRHGFKREKDGSLPPMPPDD